MPKQYGESQKYETKLGRIMERLGIQDYNYNYDRHGCWVTFTYKGNFYRFDHSVEKAKAKGINIRYGSDAFAQVVLCLEDLARAAQRGIYDLSTWVEGLKALPAAKEIAICFQVLGFAEMPDTEEEVRERYRKIAKVLHPDAGGNSEEFQKLKEAAESAIALLKEGKE